MSTDIYQKIFVKTILLLVIISSSIVNANENPTSFTYRETFRDVSSNISYSFDKVDDGYYLKVVKPAEIYNIYSNNLYQAQKEDMIDKNNDIKMSIVRENNNLIFKGEIKGKKIDKTISVENTIWYGIPFMFKGFVLSDKKTENFFFVIPEEQGVMKFKLIKDRPEIVKINGQEVNTIKVIMTFPDFRSAFWKSLYWFRSSDGLLIKTEEVRGAPGTPKTFMELVVSE